VCPLIFLGLAVVRSRKEEVMLGDAYPEYAAYKDRTSALVPGVL
jgi:protein-S-isoprenylcysteine O-methyltransferase Ste14